jgi:tetratricopeptide (TPR) repeat protein
MSKENRKKLLIVLGAVLIGVLIYLAPDSIEEKIDLEENTSESHAHDHGSEHSISEFGDIDSLDKVYFEQKVVSISQLSEIESKLLAYDSLIQYSIQKGYPPMVAGFSEKKAKLVPSEENWMIVGDNYFKAFRLSKNQSKEMIENSITSYQKVIDLNPNNLTAETAIGVAFVEGAGLMGEMPMKGIGILKGVLNKDPENIDALTNLGYFAIQSGQYEKAIERFETVLSIDPKNAEAYIYLTDVYLSQDKVDKGIETLEKYKSLVEDPLVIKQVDDYIKEIRNK